MENGFGPGLIVGASVPICVGHRRRPPSLVGGLSHEFRVGAEDVLAWGSASSIKGLGVEGLRFWGLGFWALRFGTYVV